MKIDDYSGWDSKYYNNYDNYKDYDYYYYDYNKYYKYKDYDDYIIRHLSKILHPEEKSSVSSDDMIRELQEEKMRLMEENKILKRRIDFIEKDIDGYKKRKEIDPYDEENWEE